MGVIPINFRADGSLHNVFSGAAAGFLATAPMSITMLLGWQLLPTQEKYHLPPRQITEEVSEKVGIKEYLGEKSLIGLTVLSHFGYGALSGAIYGVLNPRLQMPPALKGALAGVAVWVGSYLGWLPAMDILPPATRHPWRRNLMMLVAHVVWGVTLGAVTRKLTRNEWR